MKPTPAFAGLFLVLAGASTASVSAQTSGFPGPIHAFRLTGPITVDGTLSESAWREAEPVSKFFQSDPVEGAPATQKTEVRVAYDDDALYVGARMFDTAPDSILVRLARRDVSVASDKFTLYLDPFHDRRSGYYFLVNVAGTLYDGTLSNDGAQDASWDAVWQAKTAIDSLGWTAEMRIPYSQLRFQRQDHCVWGVNFQRSIPRYTEEDYVVFQPKKAAGFVSRFPDLVGIENVRPVRTIEVLPYLTSKASYLRHGAADPFNDGSEYRGGAGGDLRTSLGTKLTLNATVNPDFGQVELDPAVVNLSDVESYFGEKRPFFVEGASIFRFGNEGARSYWSFNWPEPQFFYSRRIGRTPQGSVPDSTFVDEPIGTTILGAAKLTGKLAQSWGFGTVHAVTGREWAKFAGLGPSLRTQVEPITYYSVARTQKEFSGRRIGLGFLSTSTVRAFDGSSLKDQIPGYAQVGGFDGWVFLDSSRTWVISGWTVASLLHGTASAINNSQQSSRHYFQRPDADHVRLDPNATSLSGLGSRYWLNRQNGNVLVNCGLGFMTPGFDVNDLGFHTRSDAINGHIGGGYKWTNPGKHKKYQDLLAAVFGNYDFDGNRTWSGVWMQGSTEYKNSLSWNYHWAYNPRNTSTRLTRGGPRTLSEPGWELGMYFDTDSKKKLFYSIDTGTYFQPKIDNYDWWVSPAVEWKPASNVLFRFGPTFEHNRDVASYLETVADTFATATYDNRYVFGDLDQKTLSANLRLNWTFTPTMSLQLYLQPLISSGDYRDFKELAQPNTFDFTSYGAHYDPASGTVDPDGSGPAPAFGLSQPDFNFRSLRGNAVFRWEFRPGSTAYLVWTQLRSDTDPIGNMEFGPSLHRLIRADADNIFLAKFTYYLGL